MPVNPIVTRSVAVLCAVEPSPTDESTGPSMLTLLVQPAAAAPAGHFLHELPARRTRRRAHLAAGVRPSMTVHDRLREQW